MCLFYLLDDCDLSQVSSRATLYQRDVCCQAHPVHMVTRRYRDRKCFIFLIIWMGWHLGVTKKCLLVEVMWEYLCYPEHSSPAQTFWRTPRCSQDCWEGGETISSKSKGPWSVCVCRSDKTLWFMKLTSWCCHGRQWYLQKDKTARRSPWPPAKQQEKSNFLRQKHTVSTQKMICSTAWCYTQHSVSSYKINNNPAATSDRG